MSVPRLVPRASAGSLHPMVLERRLGDLLLTGLSALVPAVTALAVTIALPKASLALVLAVIAGVVAIVALMVNSRLEVSVTLIALYLGLLDGPIKMFLPVREATASVQDVIILAVVAGAIMRLSINRQRIALPALSGLVFAWVLLVLVNVFNPRTESVLHVLGGFRQQLQYVPFFFFGYVLIRSKRRFRQMFLIVGVIALANGVVAAYQTGLTPDQLSSWGPGYKALIKPEGAGSGRLYFSEGEARVRPPGLGSEAGYSGSVGRLALPMCLALLAVSRRRRWLAALLCIGSLMAVVVGLGRLPLIGAGLGVVAFAVLSALGGQRFTRTMGALLATIVLAIPAGAILTSSLRSGTFKRYETIGLNSETTLHKESAWSKIPKYVAASPLGFGLGNSGATARLGGYANNLLEGHGLTGESQYNVLVKELGAPGLLLWPAIVIYVSLLAFFGMHRIRDGDLAICLAGALAAFPPLVIEGASGFLGTSTAAGPYFWFAIGVAGYWFVGPGRAQARSALRPSGAKAAHRLGGNTDASPAVL